MRAWSEKPDPDCVGQSLRFSRDRLAPLGQGGDAVLLEEVAAIEVSVLFLRSCIEVGMETNFRRA